jgi:hypothetical protein
MVFFFEGGILALAHEKQRKVVDGKLHPELRQMLSAKINGEIMAVRHFFEFAQLTSNPSL